MTEKKTEQDEVLESNETKKKWYQDKEFWYGFVGWFVFNSIAWELELVPISMLVNVVALIYFARKIRRIAFGLLSANTVNLVLVILQGAVYKAICFIPFFFDW